MRSPREFRQLRRIGCFALSAIGCLSADVTAGTAGGSVASTAVVLPICRSLTIAPLAFGNYDPAAADTTASAVFTVQCSTATPVSIALDRGSTSGGSIAARRLGDGRGNTLDYQLYTAMSRTSVWGDGSAGSAVITASGQGLDSTMQFTVHGVIPRGQSQAVPGQYSDSVTITLTY